MNVGILSGRIPLISLVQFIAVAEHLNFRHAAKALGISQSSVSARVKALEDNLGVLLFERHARGVRIGPNYSHFIVNKTFLSFIFNGLFSC
ncbi:helix-turn-helix domain-containing protein [Acinetobacter baumannii]